MKTTIPYRKFLLWLIIISTAIACSEEEMPKGPVVLTGTEVIYESEGGVRFFGKVNNWGDLEIISYGFVITNEKVDTYIYIGDIPENDVFSLHLGNGFPQQKFAVRAFIRYDGDRIIRGNLVNVVNPETLINQSIIGFSPQTGSPGDTITITGNHFGWFPGSNRVYFKTTESEIVSESIEEIRAIVPLDMAPGNYTISVSVGNQNVAFDEYSFQLTVKN